MKRDGYDVTAALAVDREKNVLREKELHSIGVLVCFQSYLSRNLKYSL